VTATFCCVQCRLLQPPTTTCVECAASTTAPVELVRELLYYRDLRVGSHRDWGMVTAFIAGTSLALPVLAPLAIGSIVALGIHKLRAARRRHVIVGIDLPTLAPPAGATTVHGVPRKLRSTVPSILDESPVLVEHAVVRDRRGAVLVRRSAAVPFLLDVDDSAPVLVTGVARVTSRSVLVQRFPVRRGDPRIEKMGVPPDFAVSGVLEIASIAADGPTLAVTGILEEEAVAELAFHREGGRTPVMRGRIGAPVLVEDRRLIAAAL